MKEVVPFCIGEPTENALEILIRPLLAAFSAALSLNILPTSMNTRDPRSFIALTLGRSERAHTIQ